MGTTLLERELHFECPNCTTTALSKVYAPVGGGQIELHSCPGLKGFLAPMVLAGTRCKVEAVEREDYLGKEDVRLNGEGRPIMAVVTTRNDGQDRTVFAPCARIKFGEL